MTESRVYPFDEPVAAGVGCRHCSDPIVATAEVVDGRMGISGLREYLWTHLHGSDVCRPTTSAKPFDAWRATTLVEAALSARTAAEEATWAVDGEVTG